MALVVDTLTAIEPLPLVPPGSAVVIDGRSPLKEGDGMAAPFGWVHAPWIQDGPDVAARCLGLVHLVDNKATAQRHATTALHVNKTTTWRRPCSYPSQDFGDLTPSPIGPKGPSKLTSAKAIQIRTRRCSKSLRKVTQATGFSKTHQCQALGEAALSAEGDKEPSQIAELVPLAAPAGQKAACWEILPEAAPAISRYSHLPVLGPLLIPHTRLGPASHVSLTRRDKSPLRRRTERSRQYPAWEYQTLPPSQPKRRPC